MPLLPEEKSHYLNYDNLDIDSSSLSTSLIRKKDGVLKWIYNKKRSFYPELFSKLIKLNIVSLVDEEIITEVQEFQEEERDDNEELNNNEKKEVNKRRKWKGFEWIKRRWRYKLKYFYN